MNVSIVKGKIHIACSPSESGAVRRTVIGARWSVPRKVWYANPSRLVNKAVLELPGVTMSDKDREFLSRVRPLTRRTFPVKYRPKTPPYAHQVEGTAHLYGLDRAAVFAEPGTGKSKMSIDAVAALYLDGYIDRVVIVCPVSVRTTWADQFRTHCPVPWVIQMIKSTEDPTEPVEGLLAIYIVGVESLSSGGAFERAARAMVGADRAVIIVDEAHNIKTHNSNRTLRTKLLATNARHRWVLTGTPIANHIGDLYSLFDFMDNDIIGVPKHADFMERYAIFGGYEGRQVVGWRNTDEVKDAVDPYIFRARKADCLDLPPKVYLRRQVKMGAEQARLYRQMKKDGAIGDLITKGPLDKALRLHQIAGGWRPAVENGITTYQLVSLSKIQEVQAILEDSEGQSVIIWCAYRHEVAALRQFHGSYGGCVQITGDMSEAQKWESVQAIQEGRARILVGTAAAGGTGITVTAASVIIYFSNTFKYTDRVQSEDRPHRPGQRNTLTIYDLVVEGTIDEHIEQALANKGDLAGWIARHPGMV